MHAFVVAISFTETRQSLQKPILQYGPRSLFSLSILKALISFLTKAETIVSFSYASYFFPSNEKVIFFELISN